MIDKISILGLWDERNYRIEFVNGSLILVGENGSGKTTVLRIIYGVLSRNWQLLYDEEFREIELKAGDDCLCIHSADIQGLEDYLVNIEEYKNSLPVSIIRDIEMYCGKWSTPDKIQEACRIYRFPEVYVSAINRILDNKRRNIPEV